MSKAIVIERCTHDVSKAERFGKVTYLFDSERRRHGIFSDEFRGELSNAFDRVEFDPDTDVFVLAGHMVTLARALDVLLTDYGPIKVLMFSAIERNYISISMGDENDTGNGCAS